MKTAYIITMHCPLNYGAILQTYALQTYIESIGINVKIVNYRPDYIVCDQSLMYVGAEQFKRNFLLRWIYRLIKAPSKLRRKKYFEDFADEQLHLTKIFRIYNDIYEANLKADFFICGSDQIWNVVSGAYKDPAYFLSFVSDKIKKISYAASGNLPISDDVKRITFPMIEKIDCISMRENSTISSIQPYIKKPISHVCDPVFLLESKVWRALYKKYSKFNPSVKYILVYPMGNGVEATMDKAIQIATYHKLPLYVISASQRRDKRVTKYFNVNPYDFLSLIDNAEYVITNSFHGVSFSIIFEKQFWACVAEGSNQRITTLLQKAGLTHRLITQDVKKDFNEQIDHKIAQNKLFEFIQSSKHFLQSSLYAQ